MRGSDQSGPSGSDRPGFPVDRLVARSGRALIVAELSASHNGLLENALALIRAAHEAGADAIKLQTYTPDTITIDVASEVFRIAAPGAWTGRTLYDLYSAAQTPWEWQPRLKAAADELGMPLFSSAFDPTSVDFLEQLGVGVYKVASFELVDLPLVERVAATGKPLIMSTGMASIAEIDRAVRGARRAAPDGHLALLKCSSAYPAPDHVLNLRTIPDMARRWNVPVGLSDHTTSSTAAVASVALGAVLIEKHICLSRALGGVDAHFSLEPDEFREFVADIRRAETGLGGVVYGPVAEEEVGLRAYRRSLFVVEDVRAGELFTSSNVRSIRPANGLDPRYLSEVLDRPAKADVVRGTPLTWELVGS